MAQNETQCRSFSGSSGRHFCFSSFQHQLYDFKLEHILTINRLGITICNSILLCWTKDSGFFLLVYTSPKNLMGNILKTCHHEDPTTEWCGCAVHHNLDCALCLPQDLIRWISSQHVGVHLWHRIGIGTSINVLAC